MNKDDYLRLLKDKPWEEIDQHFGELNRAKPVYIGKIDINPQEWIDFSAEYFDQAIQFVESTQPHYDDVSNWLAQKNIDLGRNADNTFELSYGVNGNSGEVLQDLLGDKNIETLGLKKENLLVRLIVNLPGHGVPWHFDGNGRYKKKYSHVDFDKEKVVRYWFSATDWCNGQVFQVGSEVLNHWRSGDVWQIPWGVPHASSNFGYNIKYTVSLTGILA